MRRASIVCRKLNPVALATAMLLVPVLLIACADEDAAPAGLSRAEVEEIVRAAIVETLEAESQLTPADVRRIARNEVANIPPKSAPADYTRFFVQNAISRYDAEGLDATLTYYNQEESIDDQWYVFIIDEDDKVIGHFNAHLIGEDLNGPVGTDVNGYDFGSEILSATEEGKWVSYVYHNPERGLRSRDFDELELKNVWVTRHDGLLFASGWYIDADEFTEKLVSVAVERFRAEGLPATIAYFAAPGSALAGLESTISYYNSTETADGRWSAFIAAEGEFVAHSDPEMIGRDIQELFGPGSLEVSREGNWVSTQSMHIWMRSYDGHLFGSGWHRG